MTWQSDYSRDYEVKKPYGMSKTVLINTSGLPHDAYFYKGLSELIVDIDRLIYLSLEKIRKDFVFINLSTDSLSEFINRDNEWLSAVKGKQVVLIAARKSEALANYWYYNSNIRGVVYAGLSRDIRKELVYVINGRFLRKDIKKDKITDREMEIIRMTAQGECNLNRLPELKIVV